MGKKRGPVERKPATAPSFVVTPVVHAPSVLLPFLERHARVLAVVAVLFASARIIATYNVFNHTFDEPVHIACGMEWLDRGIYTWEAQHPPLSRIMAALGPYLIGLHTQDSPRVGEVARLREGTAILYSGHNYDKALFLSRLGMLPFFWIACLVVFEWGRRYFNAAIGLLAVAAFSFEPTILAHAGLSTTDMALTAFLSATFLTGTMWLEQPTVRRAALFGVCGGLVVSSKFSCLVFFPASAALAL